MPLRDSIDARSDSAANVGSLISICLELIKEHKQTSLQGIIGYLSLPLGIGHSSALPRSQKKTPAYCQVAVCPGVGCKKKQEQWVQRTTWDLEFPKNRKQHRNLVAHDEV